jgi:hypothetical protein
LEGGGVQQQLARQFNAKVTIKLRIPHAFQNFDQFSDYRLLNQIMHHEAEWAVINILWSQILG